MCRSFIAFTTHARFHNQNRVQTKPDPLTDLKKLHFYSFNCFEIVYLLPFLQLITANILLINC